MPPEPSAVFTASLGMVASGVTGKVALRTLSPGASSPLSFRTVIHAAANGAASSRR